MNMGGGNALDHANDLFFNELWSEINECIAEPYLIQSGIRAEHPNCQMECFSKLGTEWFLYFNVFVVDNISLKSILEKEINKEKGNKVYVIFFLPQGSRRATGLESSVLGVCTDKRNAIKKAKFAAQSAAESYKYEPSNTQITWDIDEWSYFIENDFHLTDIIMVRAFDLDK